MRRTLIAALLSLSAVPAVAQDRPALYPTRDVAVTYRVNGGQAQAAGMQSITIAWLAAAQAMRMDMGPAGYMVADHRNQRGFMVMQQARMIMDVPMQQAMQQYGPSENATYRRTGSATVAGHACTVWSYQDRGNSGTACITGDGVMLRAEGTSQGQSGGMEATQVAYGAQDPSRFQRPQGYQSMQMPGGGQMPMGRPPAGAVTK
ncbi:DUF4412 domain-containing protein [Roseomonas stagni]|uniref:DUF4412 domain-containing protein n=1 Tax=Falsiroseomonas algicola TaxID=2716930 RepID=A0A6M1LL28_9PROT|nr:DUF4412 domain-containing protein [Falsiroseomonas algicola]NGM20907.1 DUF4412 domain-containing protein [Falsiroseomonas algicola]